MTDAATFTGSEGQDVPDGVESVVAVDLKDEVPGGLGADVDQLLLVRVVAHSCNSSARDGGQPRTAVNFTPSSNQPVTSQASSR